MIQKLKTKFQNIWINIYIQIFEYKCISIFWYFEFTFASHRYGI